MVKTATKTIAQFLSQSKYNLFKALNIAIIVAVLSAFSVWAARAQASDAAVADEIAAAARMSERGPYATDGSFTGSAQGFGGLVEVQVDISDGYIDSVTLLDASGEDEAWLNMAIVLLDRIKEEQSTDLDVVSGATYSSAGILNAASSALKSSIGDS